MQALLACVSLLCLPALGSLFPFFPPFFSIVALALLTASAAGSINYCRLCFSRTFSTDHGHGPDKAGYFTFASRGAGHLLGIFSATAPPSAVRGEHALRFLPFGLIALVLLLSAAVGRGVPRHAPIPSSLTRRDSGYLSDDEYVLHDHGKKPAEAESAPFFPAFGLLFHQQ